MRHFKLYELVDKETYETYGEDAWNLFHPDALLMLDDLRDFFNVPVTVNNWHSGGQFQFRGYRPPSYMPGITPGSMHRVGKAFDFDVKDHSASAARKMIIVASKEGNPLVERVTRMEEGVNWVHADIARLPAGVEKIHLFKV